MLYSVNMDRLILASASPQRTRLLEGIGIPHDVIPSSVDEDAHPELDPVKRCIALAHEKARDVALRNPARWVIGCDTLVVSGDGTLLEKPRDEADARRMIARHSNAMSVVHSGLAVLSPAGDIHSDVSSSNVFFRPLSNADIDWWIQTGLWRERSGAFQIDGPGQLMIERIEGDWTSIVGLPVFLLGRLLAKAGYPLMRSPA